MATQILIRAINQILQNWCTTLRISWAWGILFLVCNVAIVLIHGGNLAQSFGLEPARNPQTVSQNVSILELLLLWVVGIVIFVAGGSAIAIAWHRHILRDEEVGLLYLIKGQWPNGAYIVAAIKFAMINLLIFMPIALIYGFFLASFIESMPAEELQALSRGQPVATFSLITIIGAFVLASLVAWVSFRFGLVLPSVAVGNKMRFSDSRYETAPENGTLIKLSLIVGAIYVIPTTITELFPLLTGVGLAGPIFVFLGLVIQLFFVWFTTFLSVGMLTVLYGHLVEERPL